MCRYSTKRTTKVTLVQNQWVHSALPETDKSTRATVCEQQVEKAFCKINKSSSSRWLLKGALRSGSYGRQWKQWRWTDELCCTQGIHIKFVFSSEHIWIAKNAGLWRRYGSSIVVLLVNGHWRWRCTRNRRWRKLIRHK